MQFSTLKWVNVIFSVIIIYMIEQTLLLRNNPNTNYTIFLVLFL